MASAKEALARIKINKMLEESGWRFFAEGSAPANIRLEAGVPVTQHEFNALGEDFEKTTKGFVDFLLLDSKGFPFIVLEAKAEEKSPLVGKEQARKYAKSQNCRFVILSNGNLHYFWDLERGEPSHHHVVPDAGIGDRLPQGRSPDPKRLVEEQVDDDYIVLTQRPTYQAEAAWKNEAERAEFIRSQQAAVSASLPAEGHPRAAAGGEGRQETASCSRWRPAQARH